MPESVRTLPMPLMTVFRLSFFLTLALACACLALAELFFLWWVGFFLVGTLVLLGLAYRWEGRWVLSADAANRLGMVIAIGSAFWILYNLPHSDEDLQAAGVPWPAGLLPHLGPLLILLLLVKLFRPKRLSDYWVIHTIGLMMVTLGCVLAAEPLFGVLLVLYLAGLLWSLALFHLVRAEALCRCDDPAKLDLFSALGDTHRVPWRYLGLGRVARWTAPVVVLGLVLFLIAPRQDNFQWEPKQLTRAAKGILKTGFDSGMNLNRVGRIELSEDPAFEVQAMSSHGPKIDLNPETRWCMQILEYYSQGHWTSLEQGAVPQHLTWGIPHDPRPLALPSVEGRSHPRIAPADLVDPDFYVSFSVRLAAAGGLPLAEPLMGTRLGLYPHLGDNPVEGSIFFHLAGTDTLTSNTHGRRRLYQYGQVLHKLDNPNLVPAKEVHPRYRKFLVKQGVPEAIALWARELLSKLPGLTQADYQLDAQGHIPIAGHAKVAQALANHLAFSGEFGYSLDLHRRQINMDPLADFLLNVKEGHCERYAGGLTLMLRSVGIPARVVKGYRGAETMDPGHYLIRQSQAHSWVQALVEDGGNASWLTLDPTPNTERAATALLSWIGWLLQSWADSDDLWRNYIMEYNADQQTQAFDMVRNQLTAEEPWSLSLVIVVPGTSMAGAYLAWRLRRRWIGRSVACGLATDRDLAAAGTGFYPRFLKVMERHLNLRPGPGQTPREFGLLTQLCLANRNSDAVGAAIPLRLVELLYRVRYGGQALTLTEELEANRDVEMLEKNIALGSRYR